MINFKIKEIENTFASNVMKEKNKVMINKNHKKRKRTKKFLAPRNRRQIRNKIIINGRSEKKTRLSFECKHINELTVKQLHVFILSRTRSLSIMIMDVYCNIRTL